jgi:hypothetical protein
VLSGEQAAAFLVLGELAVLVVALDHGDAPLPRPTGLEAGDIGDRHDGDDPCHTQRRHARGASGVHARGEQELDEVGVEGHDQERDERDTSPGGQRARRWKVVEDDAEIGPRQPAEGPTSTQRLGQHPGGADEPR